MIDDHQCDACKKMFSEECGRSMMVDHVGEGWFCNDCTDGEEISQCDMCEQHMLAESCRTIGDMWICCDCEEHVLS